LDPPNCPYCGKKLDAHYGDDVPGTGDIAFCAHCLQTSVFELVPGALKLHPPETKEEKNACKDAKRDLLGPGTN
jgi:hypothetical protein